MDNVLEIIVGFSLSVVVYAAFYFYIQTEPRWLVASWETVKWPVYRYRGWRIARRV